MRQFAMNAEGWMRILRCTHPPATQFGRVRDCVAGGDPIRCGSNLLFILVAGRAR
jgi:hypothetical protein